ncbi:hypothetical protein FPOA_08988 [Fusarium poae]|uniref:Apple domain-containing protein n=1 Tax=Fusarium poae TaxID=36050 RepID=A0A1B8AQ51_FUSPO|nr:hypothetical protein FPOA_08988 [Fusarium poae]
MFNPKRIVTTLVGVSITAVSAGPCKPHSSSDAVSSSTLEASSGTTSLVSSVTWSSTLVDSSETETATMSAILSQSETLSTSSGTIEVSTTDISSITTEATTTTAAALATTSAAADTPCENQIYRGTASHPGYTSTDATTEADCWDACSSDQECNTWFFQAEGVCQLYRETFDAIGTPKNEDSNLLGSRNCSPRNYDSCNDNIGFGYIAESPTEQVPGVQLELQCAQLCMKDGQCEVWQYDGSTETCNKFSSYFADIFTTQADAAPGQRIMLAGTRSCSSDFFKPQLEPCNGQINTWNANAISGYRYFTHIKTVPLCARACSIDPMCLSWGVFDGAMINGGRDCSLSQYEYRDEPEDICAAGSRNCGVP